MSFYIYVHSGLNNKLIPLLSLLRIARKEGRTIKCHWGNDAYINKSIFSYNDLFENIPDIEFITKTEFDTAFNNKDNIIYNKSGSDRDSNEIIYRKNINNDINSVFYAIVHIISYQADNVVGQYVPYTVEKTHKTPIIDELRHVIRDLKPREALLNKIDNTIFKEKILGIHLRTTDGGFVDIPKNNIFKYINDFFINNPDYKIYISCDNLEIEQKIRQMYPDKIYYLKSPFGNSYSDKFNRGSYGTINAVCEMFSLSKCTKFVGTPGSSFSFMVWLLRNDDTLDFWCDNPWK